jgi:hypothetical protein
MKMGGTLAMPKWPSRGWPKSTNRLHGWRQIVTKLTEISTGTGTSVACHRIHALKPLPIHKVTEPPNFLDSSIDAGTVRNCKTLTMGSIPIVASENERFTEKFQ